MIAFGNRAGLACAMALSLGAVQPAAAAWMATTFGRAVRTTPSAISNAGRVVGSWHGAGNSEQGFPAARRHGGRCTRFDIARPGVVRTELRRISLDGRWLSGVYVDGSGAQSGFVFDRTSSSLQTQSAANTITVVQGVTRAGLMTV
jgi:hypothetical protein